MLYLAVCVVIVAIDQWFKHWVVVNIEQGTWRVLLPGIIRLTHTQNSGAAFSIMQNMRWLFLVLTVIFVAVAVWAYLRRKVTYPLGLWSLTAIVAGAAGNFIDRLRFGYVVDMFETEFMNFAVFNVADCFITVGGIMFAIYLLFFYEKKEVGKLPSKGGEDEDTEG